MSLEKDPSLMLQAMWDHAYALLRCDPQQHPLFFIENPWVSTQDREKIIQLAFEKYKVPALFLAKSSVMAAFSAGKATALVVDAGASFTSVVPVHDGYVLKKGIQYQSLAGNFVSDQIIKTFEKANIAFVPQYLVKSKSAVDPALPAQYVTHEHRREQTTDAMHELCCMRLADEFKETVCQISEIPFNPSYAFLNFLTFFYRNLLKKVPKNFEFPNGYNNSFRLERFRIPEVLFDPRYILKVFSLHGFMFL
jgi:actin-related protein